MTAEQVAGLASNPTVSTDLTLAVLRLADRPRASGRILALVNDALAAAGATRAGATREQPFIGGAVGSSLRRLAAEGLVVRIDAGHGWRWWATLNRSENYRTNLDAGP